MLRTAARLRLIRTIAFAFWTLFVVAALANYMSNLLAMPVKDLGKAFTASVMGWLLFGPYRALFIATLLLLAAISIAAAIIAARCKDSEKIEAQPARNVAAARGNRGGTALIQESDNPFVIQDNPGSSINISIQRGRGDPPDSPQTNNSQVLRDYLDSVIHANQGLSPVGIAQSQALLSVSVPLADIFIHLRAVSDRPLYDIAPEKQKLLQELEALRSRTDLDEEEREERIHRIQAQAHWQSELGLELRAGRAQRNVEIEELVQGLQPGQPLAVILGGPGAGKSTTMRWLALQMARACADPAYTLPEGLTPARIPLLVRIGDYAQRLKPSAQDNPSFKEFLHDMLANIHAALPRIIDDEMARGNCMILLDGLDEVASDETRRQVMAALNAFITPCIKRQTAEHYNCFIVTSRIVGYEAGPFAPYAHYTLLDLEDKQIRQFLTSWCPAVERHQSRAAQGMRDLTPQQEQEALTAGNKQRDRLLETIRHNPGIRRLAVNPLMLTVLALLQRSGKTLPHRRIDLYRVITLTLLDNWNQDTGRKLFSDEEIGLARELLSRLAFEIHRRDLPLTERQVTTIARETMAAFYGRSAEQIKSADVDSLVKTLRRSSGLFVERGQGLFGFFHRTFQEYYTALYLIDKRHFSIEELKTFVIEHYTLPLWREPFLLAIAYKSEQDDRDERKVANELIQAIEETKDAPDAYLQRNVLFAAACIVDCNAWYLDRALQQRIANRLFDLYGDSYGAGRYTQLQKDIEDVVLLWLRGQPASAGTTPPLLEAWSAALHDEARPMRQEGAMKLLAALATDLAGCPQSVLTTLLPPLLRLAQIDDILAELLRMDCIPPEIQAGFMHCSAHTASLRIEEYALATLRLLDAAGPAGWLHSAWLRWDGERPDLLARLTNHALELDYLLTPAALPGERADPNWDIQEEIGETWQQHARRDPHEVQVRLLEASRAARFPYAYLYRQLLLREEADAASGIPWQASWDRALQEEMQRGRSATYQTCLHLRLLLAGKNERQQRTIVSNLESDLGQSDGRQAQALVALVNIYLRDLLYLRALRALQASLVLRDLQALLDLRDLRDLLALRALRALLDLRDLLALLALLALRALRDLLYLLDLRSLRDLQYLRALLALRDLRDLRDLLALQALRALRDFINQKDIVRMLCNSLVKDVNNHAENKLLALYSIVAESNVSEPVIKQELQQALQQFEQQAQQQPTPTHALIIEQQLLITAIQQRAGWISPAHPRQLMLPPGTADERATALAALRQRTLLDRADVEEIIAACFDTREISEQKLQELTQQDWLMRDTVGEFAWKLLSQEQRLSSEAVSAAMRALQDGDALVCAAGALLLKHCKRLPESERGEAVQQIMAILADDELSRRPLDSPGWWGKRLDDVLYEALAALVR